MSTIALTFSALDQATDQLSVGRGRSATYTLAGTFDATVELQRQLGNGPWRTILSTTEVAAQTVLHPQDQDARYRMVCTAYTSGSPVATLADRAREIESWQAPDGSKPLVVKDDGLEAIITLAILSGLLRLTAIETGLTAHAGGTKAAALVLDATKTVHVVSVIGTDADSVLMPPAVAGGSQRPNA